MSEHRRKPPQPPSGGRAAARQQPSGRRATPSRGAAPADSASDAREESPPSGGRADARRAQRGGRRRAPESGPGGPAGPGRSRGPSKKRLIDYPRHDKYGWRRWTPSWKLTSGLVIGFIGSLMTAGTIAYAMVGVPNPSLASQAQNNVYYWSDNTPMVSTGGEVNRQVIGIDQIPKAMQNAVVSAENKTFWDDSGVDPMGIARAFVNMAKGGETQGGSTITQQYVKNARLGDQSQTISRKMKELFISIKVGTQMQKPAILAGYLNTSYYGRGAYGIQAAARTYYGIDANKLNPSQCAFLATLLKGATYFDPAGATEIDPAATAKANTTAAKARWKWILDEMVKDGHLTAAERAKYTAFPMPDKPKKSAQLGGQIGYLVDLAKANFINTNTQGITDSDLSKGGYEIHTTFNKAKVNELTKAVTKVYDQNIDAKKRPKTDTHVEFGGASVDPETGAIVAIYGGQDATEHFTDNADQTGAQVGSTFKPFVLAAAMRDGVRDPKGKADQPDSERTLVSPDKSLYNGKNKLKIKNYDGTIWTDKEGGEWLQTNDGGDSPGPISLRVAMRDSVNSPYVQLGMDIGIPQVRQSAIDAGLLKSSLSGQDVPSFSIGISDPSAIRMAGAYSTFAAHGQQREPYSVSKVDYGGKVVFQHVDKAKRAYSAQVADNVTDVLRTVVDSGTGTNAQLKGREVAGKTGTTDGNKSAWFVGYTPQLSTAISMYRLDDNADAKDRKFLEMYGTGGQEKIHGASFPSEIFHDYMEAALAGAKVLTFPKPEPIGEAVYGGGASSPTPTLSVEPSEEPSESPSETPEASPSSSQPAPPSPSCKRLFGCDDDGGNDDQGGDNGGDDGGGQPSAPVSSPAGDPGGTDQGGGQDNGNPGGGGKDDGGLFGGPNG